jgi:catechol 2,3-dioxygenase-like lactoylglutathione lyase family enzyme
VINHVGIQVKDLATSREFYTPLLQTLGIRPRFVVEAGIGFVGADPTECFWIGPGGGPETREVHVAFTAPSREIVRAFHRAAVEAGAEILHPPGLFPQYHPNYYGAFIRDPDGHNIEAVCHAPEP